MAKTISIIVAVAADGAIGGGGDLLWHISADLKRFKALTLGHTIIMGRKTWDSLPKGALPGRRNVVISRNPEFTAEEADVYTSLDEAFASCQENENVFVIGGAQIYRQTFSLASLLYLTKVFASYPEADAHFPDINTEEWEVINEEEPAFSGELKYQFIDYRRVKENLRKSSV